MKVPHSFLAKAVVCCFPFFVLADSSAPIPDLVIRTGETLHLPAQRYVYARVDIQPGAWLKVTPGSSSMLHLVVKDSMQLHGNIVARSFNSDQLEVTLNIPSQSPLTIAYRNTNRGGHGGFGGAGGGNVGASGAQGGLDSGGGGGGGGGRHSDRTGVRNYPGKPAQGEIGGGWAGAACGSMGGNGARRSENGNGGIVFLEVAGDLDATGGDIDVRGDTGPQGASGGLPFYPNSPHGCQSGGGGGGGGAPGGQGGFVVGSIGGNIVAYPNVQTSGGDGGLGGTTKSDGERTGTPGSNGQRGISGRVFWYKK